MIVWKTPETDLRLHSFSILSRTVCCSRFPNIHVLPSAPMLLKIGFIRLRFFNFKKEKKGPVLLQKVGAQWTVAGMVCSFTSIPWSQIHTLYTQAWCCLKAWGPSPPGMLSMMSRIQLPRKTFYFALLVESNSVNNSRSLAVAVSTRQSLEDNWPLRTSWNPQGKAYW